MYSPSSQPKDPGIKPGVIDVPATKAQHTPTRPNGSPAMPAGEINPYVKVGGK